MKYEFGRTKEQLREAFANGEEQLREDEYLGEDGLPYCKKCHGARYCVLDDNSVFRLACDCERKKWEDERRQQEEESAFAAYEKRRKLSLIGEKYKDASFDTAKITLANADAYMRCKNYVAYHQTCVKENIGLYIWGDNSTGKSHLTACICNDLVRRGYYCIYTNLSTILSEIRSSYNGVGLAETDIVCKLKNYDFAFIDDLGKEFIGREYNSSSAKWAEEKFFEILNARYNSQKPTIFTSNYSLSQLGSVLKLDKGIIERINEMSTRVIELAGADFRTEERGTKSAIAKKLGI